MAAAQCHAGTIVQLPEPTTPATVTRILVYDAELTGHHTDYLVALYRFSCQVLPTIAAAPEVVFMVPQSFWQVPGLSHDSGHASGHDSDHDSGRVHRYALHDADLEQRSRLGPRQRAQFEIELIGQAVSEMQIDELFLMNIDYFQVALASRQARALSCRVSGIQLQPYTRTELVATRGRFMPLLFMRSVRKRYRLQRMLASGKVRRLCVPGDAAATALINARHGRRVRCQMLPEPYMDAQPVQAEVDLFERYSIDKSRRIILVFGVLTPRKNIDNIISAYARLGESDRRHYTLLVIGKAADRYRLRLEARVKATLQACPESSIVLDFGFVDMAVMQAAFNACHLVAMPYYRCWQSSGILFQALRHGKPVVASNQGLIGELVAQYKLGKTVDPADPAAIGQSILDLQTFSGFDHSARALFELHTPDHHAAVVFDVATERDRA